MIIEAKHNAAAQSIFRIYSNKLLRKNFSNFFLSNLPPELPGNKSVLITPNHISWWDGFFIYKLNYDLLKRKLFVMMLQEELERYWFFRYIGAYSIKPAKPKNVALAAEYTKKVLGDHNNAAVFYPQGEIEPFEKKSLNIKRGLQLFIKNIKKRCVVLPVAFKIQHYNQKFPAIAFRAGNFISPDEVLEDFDIFKSEFQSNIDALNESVFHKSFLMDLFEEK
jgi:1-acyl-sn-glycerol-3-phosphate acyltransferase